ncbi:hypothetical protein M5K25_012973 [Dendrobium thyrsiflorum]|uniref:Uncharacterized protein n=1 Tax=Dendrobium thyrsiflorum TaxID=117978 RepID=A0ABD0V5H7_DENTH
MWSSVKEFGSVCDWRRFGALRFLLVEEEARFSFLSHFNDANQATIEASSRDFSRNRGKRRYCAGFSGISGWIYGIWAALRQSEKDSSDLCFVLYGCVEGFAESAIVVSGDSSADSESPPRFTCSICDAMSWSDSSPSGKYKSSSELQSIGNTIMQASGASFLTYFSLTGVFGSAEITRHTSVGRGFASPSSSVSPILSSDIKSASLMGCLTNFGFPGFEELAWPRCCLEVDACTLGNPFRLSTGSGGERSITSSHILSWAFSTALKISWFIVSPEYQLRLGLCSSHRIRGACYILRSGLTSNILHLMTTLRSTPYSRDLRHSKLGNFSVFGSHLSPHLSSDVGECDIFIIRMILFDFICFLFSLRTITSAGDGASLVLVLFSKLGRLGQTKIQAHWKDGLKTVAEPEVQHFFFSSASWLASLQMRKSQHCYSRMQMRVTSGCLSRVGPPGRPPSIHVVHRNDGSSCNNGREVEATKLDGSSGIPSINDSVRQLDPGSLSQLNSHWGFDAIGEHTGAGHNRNLVMPFGGESPGSKGPEQNFGSLPASPPFRGKLRETGPPATCRTGFLPTTLGKSAHGRLSGAPLTPKMEVYPPRRRHRTGFPSHHAWKKRA